jgi:hypothetical protein
MKTFPLILAALLVAITCQAQSGMRLQTLPAMPPQPPMIPQPSSADKKDPADYLVRIEWKEPHSDTKSLEVLTTEGNFEYDGIQKNSVKINNNDIPVTLKLSGTLTLVGDEKGRLQLFLGRTVPYVTSSFPNGSGMASSYSQMSVGLQSSIIVTFDKPIVIQSDENGEISVLVKRLKD